MTTSPLRARLRRQDDDGFGLVEILVALTLFALMSMAAVPLLVTSLKASTVSKLDTGAKNLAQERMEAMRNMPFHVEAVASTQTSTDLLDRYYPSLTPAANVNSAGFVAAGAARRQHEPAGPLYRTVWDLSSDMGPYRQYVAVQFLARQVGPVAPAAGWDRTAEGKDVPPTQVVGVTVITEWFVGSLSKRLPLFTEMGAGRGDAPVVTLVNRTTALTLTSSYGADDLVFEAGKVSVEGGVTTGATAASSAQGAYAALVPSSRVDGASATAAAPPTVTTPKSASSPSSLVLADPGGGEDLVSFGVTKVSGVTASTAFGLPSTGSASSPVTAAVTGGSKLTFTNKPVTNAALGISSASPVVSVLNESATNDQVFATGWSAATAATSIAASAAGSASTRTLAVLPTDFAPQGLLQVALRSSSTQCTSGGGSVSSSAAYTASVRYWSQGGYVSVQGSAGKVDASGALVSSEDGANALTELLASNPVVDGTRRLGDYFASMSSRSATGLAESVLTNARRVEVSVPAMLSLATVGLGPDGGSPVVLQLGSFTCVAEDRR